MVLLFIGILILVALVLFLTCPRFRYVNASVGRSDTSWIRKQVDQLGRYIYSSSLQKEQDIYKTLGNSGLEWGISDGVFLVVNTNKDTVSEKINKKEEFVAVIWDDESQNDIHHFLRKVKASNGMEINTIYFDTSITPYEEKEQVIEVKNIVGFVESIYS